MGSRSQRVVRNGWRSMVDAPRKGALRIVAALSRRLRGSGTFERQAQLINGSDLFDSDWYQTQLNVKPKRPLSRQQAIMHYLTVGAKIGLDPNPLFDTDWYLGAYSDVDWAHINPLVHFLTRGQAEGRLTGDRSAQAKLISQSDYFELEWYRRQLSETDQVPSSRMAAIAHYLTVGAARGLDPGRLFDTDWYLSKNPDVAAAKINPLVHFLSHGQAEGRPTGEFAQRVNMLAKSGLFDLDWYRTQLGDRKGPEMSLQRAVVHYLTSGTAKTLDPNPLFDTKAYIEANPRIVETKGNPLLHFLAKENLKRIQLVADSELFDLDWYLKQLGWGDRRPPSLSAAVAHYLALGAEKGLDPSPFFETQAYLATHPEVAAAKTNPLIHFLSGDGQKQAQLIAAAELFDLDWYKKQLSAFDYPPPSTSSAIVHYLVKGARLGLDPNPFFNTSWYLEVNPDVGASKMNPLVHFIVDGAREGRNPSPLFDIGWYTKTYTDVARSGLSPLAHFLLHGQKEGRAPNRDIANPALARRLNDIKNRILSSDGIIIDRRVFELVSLREVAAEKGWEIVGLGMPAADTFHQAGPCEFPPAPYVVRARDVVIVGGTRHLLPNNTSMINEEIRHFSSDSEVALKTVGVRRLNETKVEIEMLRASGSVIECGVHAMHEYANNYFHLVAEVLPRILLAGVQPVAADWPLLVNGGLHENFMELIKAVSPDSRELFLETGKVYSVARLDYLSDVSSIQDIYVRSRRPHETLLHTGLIRDAVNRVLSKKGLDTVSSRGRRLYVRRGTRYRGLLNEREIESRLAAAGFELLSPDGLSLEPQIRLFREADIIVSPTGAAVTNIVWCRRDTPVIVLAGDHCAMPLEIWSQLGDVSGCRVQSVQGPRAFNRIDYEIHDDYTIPIDALMARLAALGIS